MRNNEEQCDWKKYSDLAEVYVKAGHYKKAESAIEKLEEEIGIIRRPVIVSNAISY